MDREKLRAILEDVRQGRMEVGQAVEALRALPFEDLGFARPDTHRALRKGFPEVVYCPGKSAEEVAKILRRLSRDSERVLATRATEEVHTAARREIGDREVHFFPQARLLLVGSLQAAKRGHVVVVSGGTSDMPVAEEAALTSEILGNRTTRIYDVGVAGVHRLLDAREVLQDAKVVIVVAGMEGALPSVVGGLVEAPVIAVPTSVGYGATFDGLAALLAMLSSCVPGVVTVNIDNGFGAAFFASLINSD